MDELDLYDDLDEFQEQQEKKSKECRDVEEKYSKALETIQGLAEEKTCLQKNIERMELSFQSLLDTARTEINRKDKEIERLRKEKDDICFRRKFFYYQGGNTVSGEATKSILPELAKESYNLKRIETEQHSYKFQKSDCESRTRDRTSEQEDAYKSKKSWILKNKETEENSNKRHKSDCVSRLRDGSSEREDANKSKESSNLRRIETEQHLNKLQKSDCESRIRDRSSERKGSYKSKESYHLKRKESEENSNKYHKSNCESRVRDRSSERKGSYNSRESYNLKRKKSEENSNKHHKSDCESRIRDRSSERKGSYKVKESRNLTRKETEENSNKHPQKSDCVSRIRDSSFERLEESYKRQRTHDDRETYDSKRFRDDGSRQTFTDSQRHRNRYYYKTDPDIDRLFINDRLAKTDCHIRSNSQKRTDPKSYTSSSKSPCRDKQKSSRLSRHHHRKHSPHRRDECDFKLPSRYATNCNSNNHKKSHKIRSEEDNVLKTSKPVESFFKEKSSSHSYEEQLPANFCEDVRSSQQEFNNDLKCQKSLEINEQRQNSSASKFLPLECNDSLENDSLKQQRTSENILNDNATDEMHLYESLNAEAEFSLGPDEFEDLLYADLDCQSNQDILDCESNQDIFIIPEKCFSSESSAKSYEPANEDKKDSLPFLAVDNESTFLNDVTQEDSSSVCEPYSPTDVVTTSDGEKDSPKSNLSFETALIDSSLFVPSPSTVSCCETNKILFPTIMDLELQKQNNETTTATATELNNDCVSFVNENVNENHRKFDLNTIKTASLSNINKTNNLSSIKDLISLAHTPLVEEDFKNFKTGNNYNKTNCQATIIHITPAISDKSSTSTSPGDSSSDCLVVVTPTRDKADDISAQDFEQSEIDDCFINITNACEKTGAELNLSIISPGDVVEKTSSVHALLSLTAPNDVPIDLIEILSEKNLKCSKNNKNAKENPETDSIIECQFIVNNDKISSETNDQIDKKGSANDFPSDITSIKSSSEITCENDTDDCLTFSGKDTKCLPTATSAESKSSSNYVNQHNIKNEEQANIKHLDKCHESSKRNTEIEKNQLMEENKLKHKIHIETDLIITNERILESDKGLAASNDASSSKIDLDCCMDQFSSTNMQNQNSVTPEIEKFVKNVCDQEPQQPSKVYLEKQQNQSVCVIASFKADLQLPLKSLENCASLIETADLPSTEREKINIQTFASENILVNKTKCSEKNTKIWNSNCSVERESIAASPNPQKTSSDITSSQTKENISEKNQIASKSYKADLNTFISSQIIESDIVEAQFIDNESKQTNEIETIGDDKNPPITKVTETVVVSKTLSETPQPIESVLISDNPETSQPIESILTSDDENVVGDKQNSRKNCLSLEQQQENDWQRIEKTSTNENVSLASAELLHMEDKNCDLTLTSLTYDDVNDACLPDNCSLKVFSMQIITSTNQESSNFPEESTNQLPQIETEKQKESSIVKVSKIANINSIKGQNSKHSEDKQLSLFTSQTCDSKSLERDSSIESSYIEKTSLSHFNQLPSKAIEIEKEKDMSVANVSKIDTIDSIPQNQNSKQSEDVQTSSSTSQTCESHNLQTDSSIDTEKHEDMPMATVSKMDIIDSIPQNQNSKQSEDVQTSSSTPQTCDSHNLKNDSSIDTDTHKGMSMDNVSKMDIIDSIPQNLNSKQSEDEQLSSTSQTCDSHNLQTDSSIETEKHEDLPMANLSKIDIIDSIPLNQNSKQSEDEQLSSTSQTCESHNLQTDSSIETEKHEDLPMANLSKIDIIDSIPQNQNSKQSEDEQLSSTSQTCESHNLQTDSSIDTEKHEDLPMANLSKIDIIDSIPQNQNFKQSLDVQTSSSTSQTCDSHNLKKDSSIDTDTHKGMSMDNVSKMDIIDSIPQNQNSKQSEDVQTSSSTSQTCDSHNLKKDSSIDTDTHKGMSMDNVSKIDIIDSIPQNLNSKQSEDERLSFSTSETCEYHNLKTDSSIDTKNQENLPMANVSKINIQNSLQHNQNSKQSEDVQTSFSTPQTCDSHNLKKDSSIDTDTHKGMSMANLSKIDNINSKQEDHDSVNSKDEQLSSFPSQNLDSHNLKRNSSIENSHTETISLDQCSLIAEIKRTLLKSYTEKCKIIDYSEMPATLSVRTNEGKTKGLSPYKNTCQITEHKSKCHNEKSHINPLPSTVVEDLQENPKTLGLGKGKNSPQNKEIKKCKEENQKLNVKETLDDIPSNIPKELNNGNSKTSFNIPGLDLLSLENVDLLTASKLICVAEEQHVESLPNLKSIASCEKLIQSVDQNMESVKESVENTEDEKFNDLPKNLLTSKLVKGLTENHKERQEENSGKFERIRDDASTKFETQLQRKSSSLDKDNAGLVETLEISDTLISGESNNFNFDFTENQSNLENPELCLSAATQSTEFSNIARTKRSIDGYYGFPTKIAQENTLIPGLDLLELSSNKSSVNSILNKNSIEYLDDKGAAASLKGTQEFQKEMIAEVSRKTESLINDKETQRNNIMNIGSLALKEQGVIFGNVLASESTDEKICCQKKPQMKEEIENIKNLMNLTNTNTYIKSIFLSSQPKSNDHKEFNEINNNPETEKTKNTNALQTKALEYLKGSGTVNIVRQQEELANNNTVLQVNTPKANVSAQKRETSCINSSLEEIGRKEVDLCAPMLIDSVNVYSEVMSKITINNKDHNEQTSSGFDSIINYEQNLCLAEKSSGKSVLGKTAANLEKIFDKPQDYSLVDSTNKLLSSFNAAMLKTPRTNIINSAKLKPSTSNNCGFSNNLPSVSTKCPTPPNFSGIFSKTTLNDSDFEQHVLNTKKSPEGKSFIIPPTSVLSNVDNFENDTKSSKKLHWEMLENKSETLEMEDDSQVNNSSDEEKKRRGYVRKKEECVGSVKNLSTQKKKDDRQTLKETMLICKETRKFSEKNTDCRKQKISVGLKSKKASLPKRRNTLDSLPLPLGDETVEQFRQLAIRQQSTYASSFTPQNIVKKLSKSSGHTNKLKENLISSLSSNTEESVNKINKSLSAQNPEQLPNLNNDLPIVKKKRGRPPKQKQASTDEKCEKMKNGSQSGAGGGARINRDNMPKDDVAAINRCQEAERGRSSANFAKICTKKPHTIMNAGSSVHKSHMETNDLSTCRGHKSGEKSSCISKNLEPICNKFIVGAELQLMPQEAENKQMEHKAINASTKLNFKTANKNALLNFKIANHKTEVEGGAPNCNLPLLPAKERQALNKKTVKDNFYRTENYGKHIKEKQIKKKSIEQQPYRSNSKNKKESLNVSDQGKNKAKNSTLHKKSIHIPERNDKCENFVSGLKIPRSQLSPKEAIAFKKDDVKNEERVKQNITSKRRKSLNLHRRIFDTTSEEEEEEEEVDDDKTVILKPAKVNQKNKNKSERDNKKTQEKTLKEELSKDTNVENKTVNNEDSLNLNVNNIEKKKLYDQYMEARNECLRLEKLLTLSDDSNAELEKNANKNIIYKSNTFQIHKDGESLEKALDNEKYSQNEENQANRKIIRGESEIYKKDMFPSVIRARSKSMYNEKNLFKSADIPSSDISDLNTQKSNNIQLDSERSTHDLGRYQDGNLRKSIRNRRKSLPAEKGSMLISSDETETANEAAALICGELRRKESKEWYADSKERGNYKDTQGETSNKNRTDLNLWGLHDHSIKPIKSTKVHKKMNTSENKLPKNVDGKKVGMKKEDNEIKLIDQTTDLNVCNTSVEHIGISNLKRRKLDTSCNEYNEKLVNSKKTVIEKRQNEENNCVEIKASSTSVRKRRIVKVLSISIKGEERQREAKELSSISDEFENLPSSSHSIFNPNSTETSPNLMSVSQDDRYKKLDSELRDMFQSPQHETERLAQVPPTTEDSLRTLDTNETHINDTSHNVTIDETTFSTNRENSEGFLNDSKSLNSSASPDQNCTAKHISLGTSDYRFEKVSDNVVNLFITRKRKRRNK